MPNKYDDLSEEELVVKLDQGYEGEDDLAEILAAMTAKGMSGGLIGFSGDDEQFRVTGEYIEYHEKLKDKSTKKEIAKAIRVLSSKKSDEAGLKMAIMILAHTGELESLDALERYHKVAAGELKIWAQTAIDECKMFLESKLLDQPRIKIVTHSDKSQK